MENYRERNLKLKIEKEERPRTRLSFILTDDEDLTFLHILRLTEPEYQGLKEGLSIKVDFQKFPDNVAKFVAMASQHEPTIQIKVELKQHS